MSSGVLLASIHSPAWMTFCVLAGFHLQESSREVSVDEFGADGDSPCCECQLEKLRYDHSLRHSMAARTALQP